MKVTKKSKEKQIMVWSGFACKLLSTWCDFITTTLKNHLKCHYCEKHMDLIFIMKKNETLKSVFLRDFKQI